ncbi:hypothetical protein EGW08_018262 [Elysia chlorotica]|uniref:Uncharacterized protein n=1 Tax=Elysia chlorotica TaxID=188477 RepID=A0A3S0Z9T3_ELYCH|nr:hypothetical protein EGW08_018262 [Elysia chlorotica]
MSNWGRAGEELRFLQPKNKNISLAEGLRELRECKRNVQMGTPINYAVCSLMPDDCIEYCSTFYWVTRNQVSVMHSAAVVQPDPLCAPSYMIRLMFRVYQFRFHIKGARYSEFVDSKAALSRAETHKTKKWMDSLKENGREADGWRAHERSAFGERTDIQRSESVRTFSVRRAYGHSSFGERTDIFWKSPTASQTAGGGACCCISASNVSTVQAIFFIVDGSQN